MERAPEQGPSIGDQQGRLTMLFRHDDPDTASSVVASAAGNRATVRLVSSPGTLPDAAINALHEAVAQALAHNPRCVVLDLTASPGADSRLVALTCDAMRLCRRQRARLLIRCNAELRAWLIVYQIPGVRRVLEVRGGRPSGGRPALFKAGPELAADAA
jgi:hypothetical protein